MHRRILLRSLTRYAARFPDEKSRVTQIRDFVRSHADCFERSCAEGHVTGSAWVLSPDGAAVLLTRHRQLGMWLQLGGHADGDPDAGAVALREAREESGIAEIELIAWHSEVLPFDVDVHRIPATRDVPAHLHLDLRYLMRCRSEVAPRPSRESIEVRWVPRTEIEELTREESVLRMVRKADELLETLRAQST